MPNKPSKLPRFDLYLVSPQGSNRLLEFGAEKLSEAFDKESTPSKGSVCALIGILDNYDPINVLYGFAITKSRSGVAARTLRATLSPVYLLSQPVGLDELDEQGIRLGDPPSHYYAQSVSRTTAIQLLKHLTDAGEGLQGWLISVLGTPREFPASVEQARTEARDAVMLAAQIAKIELPQNAFANSRPEKTTETILDTVINKAYERDLEEELMPLDLLRFDGKLVPDQRAASLTVFEDSDRNRRLLVMSVNKKPLEEELGIDLLYWDQVHDAFTFLQYKRLEKDKTGNEDLPYEWVYRREKELSKQLELMPGGVEKVMSVEDWRAFGTPFWFKFVRGDAAEKLDGKSLKGMYVSADWLRYAIKDGAFKTGKRGGFRVTYGNTKYVGRTTFAELVTRGFTGTGRGRTEAFRKVMEDLGRDRELIVAIRAEWNKDETTPQMDDLAVFGNGDQDGDEGEAPF